MGAEIHGAESNAGTLRTVESSSHSNPVIRRFGDLVASGSLDTPDGPLAEPLALISAAIQDLDAGLVFDVERTLDGLAEGAAENDLLSISIALFVGERALIGNRSDYYDPANSMIDRVLTTRRGIPISLSVILIEVARRRGVDMVGVGMPAHFIAARRPASGESTSLFVDSFNKGRFLDRDACERLFRTMAGPGQPFDPAYLDPVTSLAVVERTLNNLKASFARRGDLGRLRTVMRLRNRIPGLAASEGDEFRRLMAPLN